jgi:glycosyltransferase involved in cell wall biosynthesis
MKIAIDATSVAHGRRAIRRCSKNIIETITRIDPTNDYKILYIDWRRQRRRYALLPDNPHVKEFIVPIPERFLKPSWQYLNLPKSEWLIGAFDIFYATDLYFPPSSHGLVLGSVHGIAYYVIQDKLDPREVNLLKKGLAYTLRHADYLLAVSNKTKENLIEHLGIKDDRIYVVSHGVDPHFQRLQDYEALSARLNERLGFSSPYILFVGAIGHHKNIMGILTAYSIMRTNGFDIPLVMAGAPGSAWGTAKRWIIKEGLERSVHLIGPIDQDSGKLTDLYNGACLFVFPSFYEGWTSPPLEDMACGTPVIASNCSSIPETVGDSAIKVDPNNSEELAYEMGRVLSNESLRKELIKKGLSHVASHTWEKSAARLIEVFGDIRARGPWKGQRK